MFEINLYDTHDFLIDNSFLHLQWIKLDLRIIGSSSHRGRCCGLRDSASDTRIAFGFIPPTLSLEGKQQSLPILFMLYIKFTSLLTSR